MSLTQGQATVLTWTSTNAAYANLSTVGSVGLNGSITQYPNGSTVYTLTVTNSQGQAAYCYVSVGVTPPPYNPPVYNPPTYNPPTYNPPVYNPPVYNPPVYNPPVYNPPIYHTPPPVFIPPPVYNNYPPIPQYIPYTGRVAGAYISLSQIPYTGFDFSPQGEVAYWLGLIAFAGSAAYLLLYFKGGIRGFMAQLQRGTRRREEDVVVA